MNRQRVYPAYSLEIVVSLGHVSHVERIAGSCRGPVVVRRVEPDVTGWARLILSADSETSLHQLHAALRRDLDFHLAYCEDRVLESSRGGKTRTHASIALENADDLAIAYTPGVARVSTLLANSPDRVDELTGRANRIAIVTDGSAVLGLGNLGPGAALPVMEGKAALFARLAGIDAVPICLATQDVDEIVSTVAAIAPGFGGINLEDISAPRCFAVEEQLRERLQIPVIHDDQHGTAVVVLAALLNALLVVGKSVETARIVVSGAGAAGTAVTRLLLAAGARDVVVWAPVGVLHLSLAGRIPDHKLRLARDTNPRGVRGGLADALAGADAFIGVSAPGVLTRDLVASMAPDPVVFALANPEPEIDPDTITDLAAVIATGRSDYPNQVNNALAFPGLFRGVLGRSGTALGPDTFVATARTLALLRENPSATNLLPDIFDARVVPAVARAVAHSLDTRPADAARPSRPHHPRPHATERSRR